MTKMYLQITMIEGYVAKRAFTIPRDITKLDKAWNTICDGIENGLITGLEARITK